MLLGNKLDIIEGDILKRAVLIEEAQRICSEQGIYWGGECSAKTFDEDQIKEIFEKFMKQVYLKLLEEQEDNDKSRQMTTVLKVKKKKRHRCCQMEV